MNDTSNPKTPSRVEAHIFADDGSTPNHPALPLLVFRETGAEKDENPASWFERRFVAHDWGSPWRWTVYSYHHYHSTNHEVLGVSRGSARLMLGGESGVEINVGPGDALIIPAGVGHKRIAASTDFQVVGAYPGGREPDLIVSGEGDISTARQRIALVPLPKMDPVYGNGGPLIEHWKLQ